MSRTKKAKRAFIICALLLTPSMLSAAPPQTVKTQVTMPTATAQTPVLQRVKLPDQARSDSACMLQKTTKAEINTLIPWLSDATAETTAETDAKVDTILNRLLTACMAATKWSETRQDDAATTYYFTMRQAILMQAVEKFGIKPAMLNKWFAAQSADLRYGISTNRDESKGPQLASRVLAGVAKAGLTQVQVKQGRDAILMYVAGLSNMAVLLGR